MRTLLLIPSYARVGIGPDIEADVHPTMDYDALRRALASLDSPEAVELVDYAAIDASRSWAVRAVARAFGKNAGLAMVGYLRRGDFDAVFSNAENVALPLALLYKLTRRRPLHVTIGHRLSTPKKRLFFKRLRVHEQMDAIVVYASTQLEYAVRELGIPPELLRLVPFHADHRFYRPLPHVPEQATQVCSAGLEWRDYPTLIEGLASATDLRVFLAAASPWSKHSNETASRSLPAHIDARRYDYHGLRDLYARSSIVVVPLYENDFQAGITTLLEAMAMGKPVIVTRTAGQCDVIVHEQNGLYVEPGDSRGWALAIERLRNDTALRERLGAAARAWVEQHATLDHWVRSTVAALRGEPAPTTQFGRAAARADEPSSADEGRTGATKRELLGATHSQ